MQNQGTTTGTVMFYDRHKRKSTVHRKAFIFLFSPDSSGCMLGVWRSPGWARHTVQSGIGLAMELRVTC